MSRPILPTCVKCNLEMRPDKNGVTVVLMAYDPPEPYESYNGDLVKCPNCDTQVITGYGQNALWRNFHDEPAPDITKEEEGIFAVYERIQHIYCYLDCSHCGRLVHKSDVVFINENLCIAVCHKCKREGLGMASNQIHHKRKP